MLCQSELDYSIVTHRVQKIIGGKGGIRTHGLLRVAGFQDRFLQPLGHLSTNRRLVIVAHLPGGCQDVLPVLRKIVGYLCANCGRCFYITIIGQSSAPYHKQQRVHGRWRAGQLIPFKIVIKGYDSKVHTVPHGGKRL